MARYVIKRTRKECKECQACNTYLGLVFYCKYTDIYIYARQRLRYPRETLQVFAYIPGDTIILQLPWHLKITGGMIYTLIFYNDYNIWTGRGMEHRSN